jgi:hypothetical protein
MRGDYPFPNENGSGGRTPNFPPSRARRNLFSISSFREAPGQNPTNPFVDEDDGQDGPPPDHI